MTGHEPPATRAREHLLDAHVTAVEAVLAAADAVAEAGVRRDDTWFTLADGRRATADRDALVPSLRTALDRSGVLERLATVLVDAVAAAGYDLPAQPVAAPPYVAVTSTGPVLRGTVADGRLVVSIDCFEVVRDADRGEQEPSPANRCASNSPHASNRRGSRRRVVYARSAADPTAALSVRFRGADDA